MNSLLLPISIAGLVSSTIVILVLLVKPSGSSKQGSALAERVATYSGTNRAGKQDPEVESLLARLREGSSTRTAQILEKQGWSEKLTIGLAAAGMSFKPEEFVLMSMGCGALGAITMFLASSASIPAGVFGFLIGVAIPVLVMRAKVSKRQVRFVNDMPDMLTSLASALSAGAAVGQALETTAEEAEGPMADELSRVLIETRLGTSIPDALEDTADRMKCPDLRMVVMAMRLQAMHGGNLSELLNTVAATLRERVQMARHVRALSAEGRLSLLVLISLPFLVLAFMAVIRPEYFMFFLTTAIGMVMLGVAAIMLLCGYLWGRAVVKVEI